MILTCPSCATSYFTPDEAIGPNGRKVRCQACAHIWHARLNDEPLDLTAPAEAVAVAPDSAAAAPRDDAPDSLAETPAPELPRAFRARAERQRRVRRAATHGAVWAGLASVFIGILAAAWLFRVEVVELYPRAAAAYAMVGAPVNPTGLDFEAVKARPAPNAPDRVLVSGALRNVRDREVIAPPVRVALLDAHGAEIGHAIVRIDAAPVLPGGVQGFAALIHDPGAKAAGVGVDFIAAPRGARTPTGAADKAQGGDHDKAAPAASHSAPAPAAHRPLPTADHGALRPAISDEIHSPMRAIPVDARPLTTEALDSGHGEALSASHG